MNDFLTYWFLHNNCTLVFFLTYWFLHNVNTRIWVNKFFNRKMTFQDELRMFIGSYLPSTYLLADDLLNLYV